MNQDASTSLHDVVITSYQDLNISAERTMAAAEGNQPSRQDTDFHTPELYSALVSGSLFDAKDNSGAMISNTSGIIDDKEL